MRLKFFPEASIVLYLFTQTLSDQDTLVWVNHKSISKGFKCIDFSCSCGTVCSKVDEGHGAVESVECEDEDLVDFQEDVVRGEKRKFLVWDKLWCGVKSHCGFGWLSYSVLCKNSNIDFLTLFFYSFYTFMTNAWCYWVLFGWWWSTVVFAGVGMFHFS